MMQIQSARGFSEHFSWFSQMNVASSSYSPYLLSQKFQIEPLKFDLTVPAYQGAYQFIVPFPAPIKYSEPHFKACRLLYMIRRISSKKYIQYRGQNHQTPLRFLLSRVRKYFLGAMCARTKSCSFPAIKSSGPIGILAISLALDFEESCLLVFLSFFWLSCMVCFFYLESSQTLMLSVLEIGCNLNQRWGTWFVFFSWGIASGSQCSGNWCLNPLYLRQLFEILRLMPHRHPYAPKTKPGCVVYFPYVFSHDCFPHLYLCHSPHSAPTNCKNRLYGHRWHKVGWNPFPQHPDQSRSCQCQQTFPTCLIILKAEQRAYIKAPICDDLSSQPSDGSHQHNIIQQGHSDRLPFVFMRQRQWKILSATYQI